MPKRKIKKTKNVRVGKKVLQLLSAAAQTLDTFGDFTYHPYPYLYSSLGHVYGKETINEAVNNLLKQGVVEGNPTDGLRVTLAGADVKKSLTQARRKDWDGRWRVVIFDIPEVQRGVRDEFRFELKKLGFGLWQRSVWVSPFDIAAELSQFLEKNRLSEVVQIVVGERFSGSSDRQFAAKIWPLNEINKEYATLLADWEEELKKNI